MLLLRAHCLSKPIAPDPSTCKQKIYRKIPKISPSMYKPLQIYASQTRNTKNPPLNRPSKYKPPGGLYLETALKYQVKQPRTRSPKTTAKLI